MTKLIFSLNDNEQNAKLTLFTTLINMLMMISSKFQPFQTVTFGYMCYNLVQLGAHQGLLTRENLKKLFYTGILLHHIYNESSSKKKIVGVGLLYMMIQTFTTNDKLIRLYIGEHLNYLTDQELINKNMISVMSSFNDLSGRISSITHLKQLDDLSTAIVLFEDAYQEHLRELIPFFNCFGLSEKNTLIKLLSSGTKDKIISESKESEDSSIFSILTKKSKKNLDKYSDPEIVNSCMKQLDVLQNAFESLRQLDSIFKELKYTCSNDPSSSIKAIKVEVVNNVGVNIPYLFYMIFFKLPIQQGKSIIDGNLPCNPTKYKQYFEKSENESKFIESINIEFQYLVNRKKDKTNTDIFLSLNKNINPILNNTSEINKELIKIFYELLNRECEDLI